NKLNLEYIAVTTLPIYIRRASNIFTKNKKASSKKASSKKASSKKTSYKKTLLYIRRESNNCTKNKKAKKHSIKKGERCSPFYTKTK
ncbi:hypothetical protein, partial [Myroides odoratus]|uniref:hypothetical protein n=1 Tax=Myroides odoratus TaxID=256 RepID=UPI003341399C